MQSEHTITMTYAEFRERLLAGLKDELPMGMVTCVREYPHLCQIDVDRQGDRVKVEIWTEPEK